MAHILTFSSEFTAKVNNVSVSSPYTLKNGDTIVINNGGLWEPRINGILYSTDTSITINNEDIGVANPGGIPLPENITVTIHYTEPEDNIEITLTSNGSKTYSTKGKYVAKNLKITTNVQPTIQSLNITPSETTQTFNSSNFDGYKPVNVSAIPTETKTIDLNMASGSQVINASNGKYMKAVTITKPSTFVASNIKSGVTIGGVVGTYNNAKPEETKTVTLAMSSGNQIITPNSGKVLTQVTVQKPEELIASNIKKDVNIGGVVGTFEGVSLPTYTGAIRQYLKVATYATKPSTNITTFYSIDNGTNWVQFSEAGELSSIASQAKFRISSAGNAEYKAKITSASLGMNLELDCTNIGMATSDNYAMAGNVEDIAISFEEIASGYTVTLNSRSGDGYEQNYGQCYYSINENIDTNTWTSLNVYSNSDTILKTLNNVQRIKFKLIAGPNTIEYSTFSVYNDTDSQYVIKGNNANTISNPAISNTINVTKELAFIIKANLNPAP